MPSSKMKLQGRVTEKLGLALNERLHHLMPSRIEYGNADFFVSFEIARTLDGNFKAVTEAQFAKHPGERNVGIFGAGNPVEALRLLLATYPDACVLMRREGKRRHTRKQTITKAAGRRRMKAKGP